MKRSHLAGAALTIAVGFSVLVALGADDKKKQVEPDAETAAWMAANQLVEQHKALQNDVGTWDIEGLFWMGPGAPPTETKGVSKIRSILGGRFIQEDFEGDFMGQAFQGMGIVGFDTMRNVYVSMWLDSMTNMIMKQDGIADPNGETIAYYGEHPKPGGPGLVKTKMVYKVLGPDKRRISGFELEGNGGERKTMILNYTRRK